MVDTTAYAFGRQYRIVFGLPERNPQLYVQTGIVTNFTSQGIRDGLIDRGVPPSLLASNTAGLRSPDARTIPQDAYETQTIEFEADIIRNNKDSSASQGEKTIFKIKNLNPENRARLERPQTQFMLFAGYDSTNGRDQLIYSGDVVEVDSKRVGQNWITEVRCKQNIITFRNTVISLTYPEGATLEQILRDLIARSDGLSIGVDGLGDARNIVFPRGISYFGRVDKILDQICDGFNLTWVNNNGKIIVRLRQIRKDSEAFTSIYRKQIIVNPRNIKEASFILDNSNKAVGQSNNKKGVRLRLFLTQVSAENIITIADDLPNGIAAGDYLVTSVKYELQSRRGSKWDTIVETEAV